MMNKNGGEKYDMCFQSATKILLGAIKQQHNIQRGKYGLFLRLREKLMQEEENGLGAGSSSCETDNT